MRSLNVIIFDKDTSGSYQQKVEFDDVLDFTEKVDAIIDETGFRKCYTDFEIDIFRSDEIEILKVKHFL